MRYTVEYNYNPQTDGYDYVIREYRKPTHVISQGWLPKMGEGFESVREYIICYGIKED